MLCRILRLIFLSASFAILMSNNGYSSPSDSSGTWTLVWNDEFGGTAGESPDAGNWGYDIGTDWGNAQLEYDTDRPSNVSLDGNGNLAIIAREESYMGRQYTSARIVTRGLYEPTYGRVEARINLPTGQGIWPAFWMLGSDFTTVGWPQCGEIDIMEYLGHQTNTVYGTIHGPGAYGGGGVGTSYVLEDGQFDTDFHVFAVEWEEDVIRWYVDDVNYYTVTPDSLGGNEWVFDHPFYIILNVAVGGNWPGPPDGSTVFPQTMLVDYVRV
ncbi:MAG: glycoside hydrolase family 16 protein, partial [candidate division Zixibacteria bacterium]|nr:glycoside hydrolase family 16 protein [candidate division Zixibacteria bacterium]